MLVSDSRKLIFIHVQKTGGLTITNLLREHVSDIQNLGARHQFAIQGMKELDGWDEYFKFAFVRNPWDRLVSWYAMISRAQKVTQKTGIRPENRLWLYAHDNSSNFEEFIYNCTDEVHMRGDVHYSFAYNQLDYLTDESGNLLVDFIGRFENFEEDAHKVLRRVGTDLESIPHYNRHRHRHYSTYYTPETEMIVSKRFKRDIEYFGYKFERPHTR